MDLPDKDDELVFPEGQESPPLKKKGTYERLASPIKEKVRRGKSDAWHAALNFADKSTPLNLKNATFAVKIGTMVLLFLAFCTGLVISILENSNCTEQNGCLSCSILNEQSAKKYDADNVVTNDKLGIQTQTLISSCSKLDLNPAKKSIIKDKLRLREDDWDTLITDLVQLNLYFLDNDCNYYHACNQHEWKSCDGGTGEDAYSYDAYGCVVGRKDKPDQCVWPVSPLTSANSSELLTELLMAVRTRALIMDRFEYDDDDVLKGASYPKEYRSLLEYMRRGLGYTDVRKGHEWTHIKETMMMVCQLRSLWTFSSRVYVASKLAAYVNNGCTRIDDGRKLSSDAVANVASIYLHLDGPDDSDDLWSSYFSAVTLNTGALTARMATHCSQDPNIITFSANRFMNHIDSDRMTQHHSEASTCERTKTPTTSPVPTSSPTEPGKRRRLATTCDDTCEHAMDGAICPRRLVATNSTVQACATTAALGRRSRCARAEPTVPTAAVATTDAATRLRRRPYRHRSRPHSETATTSARMPTTVSPTRASYFRLSLGVCDDGGPGASYSVCVCGTDCTDCGSRSDEACTSVGDGTDDPGTCDNSCDHADDGVCDDGGPGSSYSVCSCGTDCADCGSRPNGCEVDQGICDNTCEYAGDGECDDGGPGSSFSVCDCGSDCGDCGSRSDAQCGIEKLCEETCAYANDGDCDDGGEGATFAICTCGTDCSDCGARSSAQCPATVPDEDASAVDPIESYGGFYYYYADDNEETETVANPTRRAANNLLMKPLIAPGGDWCNAGYPNLEIRPFAVAATFNASARDGCYTYRGAQLIYSPAFLYESPCGFSNDDDFEFEIYGKYGTSESEALFTYISIQASAVTDVQYTSEACMPYTAYARLELRPVKHVRSSCTPYALEYYENSKQNPSLHLRNDGLGDDDADGYAYGFNENGTGFDRVVKTYSSASEDEYFGGVRPPNLDFTSEAEICGPYPQLGSDPSIVSGLRKVCLRKTLIDSISTTWAFAGLWLTAAGITLAVLLKTLHPKISTDAGLGSMLMDAADAAGGIAEEAGVEVDIGAPDIEAAKGVGSHVKDARNTVKSLDAEELAAHAADKAKERATETAANALDAARPGDDADD